MDGKSILSVVKQRGGVKVISDRIPKHIRSRPEFLCRIKCNDGSVVDVLAQDASATGSLLLELMGDSDAITGKAVGDFVTMVSDSDPFVSIIKGHVYIDAVVTSMLSVAFIQPKELEIDRMTFRNKVNLCVAAGLIHSDAAQILRKFAGLRNSFAHQLWPTVTQRELLDLLNALRGSPRFKSKVDIRPNEQLDVFACVWPMYMYLFEQACRIATNRKSLIEFWQSTIDVENVTEEGVGVFPGKPMTFSEILKEFLLSEGE